MGYSFMARRGHGPCRYILRRRHTVSIESQRGGRTRPAYVFFNIKPELDWPEDKPLPANFFSVVMEEYEGLFKVRPSPVEGLTLKQLSKPPNPMSLHYPLTPHAKPQKSAALDPAYLNDITFGEFQVVTEAFKDLVEEMDPGVHHFIPVPLIWDDGTEITSPQLYRFVCGRLVEVDTMGVAPSRGETEVNTKYYMLPEDERRYLPTLLAKPEIYEALEAFPIWSFWRRRDTNYISEAFLDAATARGLRGFALSDKRTVRDVQPVIDLDPEKYAMNLLIADVGVKPPPAPNETNNGRLGLIKQLFRRKS